MPWLKMKLACQVAAVSLCGTQASAAAAACDAPAPSHSTLLYVLSVDSPEHNARRCYHRAMHRYLGVHDGRMTLALDEVHRYRLRLFYVLDLQRTRSVVLQTELAGPGQHDLLELRHSATCLQKIIACLRHANAAASAHGYDSIVIGDDDAVFHPHRFMFEMAEAADPHLLIGQLSWVGYWNRARQRHRGFANTPHEVAHMLADPKRTLRNSTTGPFVFPVGMWMGLGAALVQHLASAMDTDPDLIRLQADLEHRAVHRKCSPATDSGLGYILFLATRSAAVAPLRRPLKFVDLSSTERIHFWRNGNTPKNLKGPLAMLHGAKVWDDHHRFFACTLSQLPAAGTAVELSLPHECELALPHFSRACDAARGGSGRNASRPESSPAPGVSCVSYFLQMWPADTVWCRVQWNAARRRCAHLTVRGAPCNTSVEQTGCPATAK